MAEQTWKRRATRAQFEKHRKNDTKFQSTQRDIDALFIDVINRGRGKEIKKQFKNEESIKELQRLCDKLTQYRDEIEVIFDELKQLYQQQYFTGANNGYTTELFHLLQTIGNGLENKENLSENLALALKNTPYQSDLQDIQKRDKMQSFIERYFDLKQSFFEASSQINMRTEQLRGDQQYYGIFLEAARNKAGELLDPKKVDHFVSLSRQQFEQFEKENSDLFEIQLSERYQTRKGNWSRSEGTARGFGLKSGVTSEQVYDRMKATFGESLNDSLLEQVFIKTNNGQTYTHGQLFSLLQQSKNENLSKYTSSRRLEMLFDSNFRQALMQGADIESAINQIEFSKYKENIAGMATGDVNLQSPNGQTAIAFQLKFKSANFLPWNNQGFQGIIDAINTYITVGQRITASDILNTDGFLKAGTSQEQLINIVETDPRFHSGMEEIASEFVYEEMGNGYLEGITVIEI